MMPAPFKDRPLRRAQGHQLTKLIPAEPRVGPQAREVDRIGGDVVTREQLLRPAARIIVDANEAARLGRHEPMMEKREIFETEFPGRGFKKKP